MAKLRWPDLARDPLIIATERLTSIAKIFPLAISEIRMILADSDWRNDSQAIIERYHSRALC